MITVSEYVISPITSYINIDTNRHNKSFTHKCSKGLYDKIQNIINIKIKLVDSMKLV